MGVAVVMGSKSDLELVRGALDTLESFGVEYTARVISAHRTPVEAAEFGSACAAVTVRKLGQTGVPSPEELIALFT